MGPNVTFLDRTEPKIVDRWVQACASRFAMTTIANLRFFRTLFTRPHTPNLPASLAAIQYAFALFVPPEPGLCLVSAGKFFQGTVQYPGLPN